MQYAYYVAESMDLISSSALSGSSIACCSRITGRSSIAAAAAAAAAAVAAAAAAAAAVAVAVAVVPAPVLGLLSTATTVRISTTG